MLSQSRIIGVDPGSEQSGMVILEDGQILAAFNLRHSHFWSKVTNYLLHPRCIVVIEDIRPYSVPLAPQVIDTAKFIGEALYRLRIDAGAAVELVTRSEVKKWVFDQYTDLAIPYIRKKNLKKGFQACDTASREEILVFGDGEKFRERKPSFVSVDDKIVTEAMKLHYGIPLPPPGSGYQYGLKDDAWQALALATLYYARSQQK